ncbi:MAG: type II CAAX endopeptidase family protein [Anaerolineaceae bacterium]
MDSTAAPHNTKQAKTVLTIIIALAYALTLAFWVAVQAFHLQGLPLYFTQLGLYASFFLLAWWGIRRERLSLPVTGRHVLEALAWSVIGWLVYVLLLQLIGMIRLPAELQVLRDTPAWKIGLNIISTWLFVGLGEEVLFRGYLLKAFWRYCTAEGSPRRMLKAVLIGSAVFSLWHLPARIVNLLSGELDWVTLLISLVVLFMMGLGFSWLYLRSNNILLTGLVHGLIDYPLIGKDTQLSFLILLAAIGCVELVRLAARSKPAPDGAQAEAR